jgi:DNA-directed RNA polymerase subunit RPC12/RpoP
MQLVLFTGLGLAPLAGAFLLLRRSVTEVREVRCPQCGGSQHERAGLLRSLQGSRLMYFPGGFLASLRGASRERQVRCVQCDTLYFTETKGSRIAGTLLWIFLLMLLLAEILQQFAR